MRSPAFGTPLAQVLRDIACHALYPGAISSSVGKYVR